MTSHPHRLILASTSPRRVTLLRDAGFVFSQVAPPVDDSQVLIPEGATVAQATVMLADMKAASVYHALHEDDRHVILACDTLLSVDGRLIGKPADEGEARTTLSSLMGRTHEVTTGVVLLDCADRRHRAFTDTAKVTIAPPPQGVLERYVQSGRWRGKAGGYNLAELSDEWGFEVEGDTTTVVGLPMEKLKKELSVFDPRCLPGER